MNLEELDKVRGLLADAKLCGDDSSALILEGWLRMYIELRDNGACTCQRIPRFGFKCSRCKALETADQIIKAFPPAEVPRDWYDHREQFG